MSEKIREVKAINQTRAEQDFARAYVESRIKAIADMSAEAAKRANDPTTTEAIRLASEANRSLGEALGLLGEWLNYAQGGYCDQDALDRITLSAATREFLARARKETGDG